MEKPYYVVGHDYKRVTKHGIQNLHRGEDVVPTGSDSKAYPYGTYLTPIRALADFEVLQVWDNGSVGGYNQAILVNYPDFGIDVLYGHVARGSMAPSGSHGKTWQVLAKMGTRSDALDSDIHTHVQVALQKNRASTLRLGTAFNDIAVDPRQWRIRMGEPDMPLVTYYGPHGPLGGKIKAAGLIAVGPGENCACGDSS